ncbi:MAG TPA: aldehyde ferredoxin oxidoreductase family protein [Anaerolineae bacterium]|nr:aldehyde ferredoxin oxidoreductase family protein [Anaerolineae bacterium]
MYYGYSGAILRINLTDRRVTREPIDRKLCEDYVGGRGLTSYLLYREMDPAIDPLGPENKLMFGAGPLTGTGAVAASRYVVVCKSPLTGTIACSNSGGFFGPEMKFAGYDAIIFEGKAQKPVYVWINDEHVEIRPADHLWGKTPEEIDDAVRAATNPLTKVACIGPAGEKLSLLAGVVNDRQRLAARSGVGAVMGSKNLKAVAVRGTGSIRLADPESFWFAALDVLKKVVNDPVSFGSFRAYGTANLVNLINEMGAYPTRNFQEEVFEGAAATSGEAIAENILLKNRACFACPIACTRVSEVKDGPYQGRGEGPEYETTWAFGALCGVSNLEAIAKANFLCRDYGIDSISAGATVACAMELFEKGYAPESDIGFPLRFGDAEAMIRATIVMGERDGEFGALMADGSYRLAAHYGHPELFMGVKKLEMAAYSPRVFQGMALHYATSNRGACHVRGNTVAAELYGIPKYVPPDALEGKEELVRRPFQNSTAFVDSSGICLFTKFAITHREIVSMMAPATGIDFTFDKSIVQGDRIWNMERLFNLRAGFTAADDTLPDRMLEPVPGGPRAGSRAELQKNLQTYYQLRGWDERGVPTRQKLAELGLEDIWGVT